MARQDKVRWEKQMKGMVGIRRRSLRRTKPDLKESIWEVHG